MTSALSIPAHPCDNSTARQKHPYANHTNSIGYTFGADPLFGGLSEILITSCDEMCIRPIGLASTFPCISLMHVDRAQ